MGGSCGYENKTLTQSLSECQGAVRGTGVWLSGMRIPIHLALWLKMSLSLSLGLECTIYMIYNIQYNTYNTIQYIYKCDWAVLYFRILTDIVRNIYRCSA